MFPSWSWCAGLPPAPPALRPSPCERRGTDGGVRTPCCGSAPGRRGSSEPPRGLVCSESCVCGGVASLPELAVRSGPRGTSVRSRSRVRPRSSGMEEFTGAGGSRSFLRGTLGAACAPCRHRREQAPLCQSRGHGHSPGCEARSCVRHCDLQCQVVVQMGVLTHASRSLLHAENSVTGLFSFAVFGIYLLLSPWK